MEDKLYTVTNNRFDYKGLTIKSLSDKNEGWVVWAVKEKSDNKDGNEKFNYLVYRHELNFEKGKTMYDVNDPKTDNPVVGGVYVLPEVTSIGVISFRLLGVLHSVNNKWKIIPIVNDIKRSTAPKADQPPSDDKKPKLVQEPDDTDTKNSRKQK